jgi:peptidoglycan/xylan/chitin deacetylase (PgdA/CDA1 family)
MKTCFVSIDVERDNFGKQNTYEGAENLDSILDVFKKHRVSATLFISGQVLEHYPDLVRKWAKNYEIGCHNYSHQYLDELDLLERERQLKKFVEVYRTILEKSPKGFRAPRNIMDNEQYSILKRYGFLYDSSVLPRYPWPIRRYEGYRGRAPISPYWPDKNNYRKKSPSTVLGASNKLLEIPETPISFGIPVLNIPLVATWLRKWGTRVFKRIFWLKKPKFISFSMHSWDGVEFKGGKNSGEKFLRQLDEMLGFLKKIGYEFKSGEKIYGEFCKNK